MIQGLSEISRSIDALEQAIAGSKTFQSLTKQGPGELLDHRIYSDTVLLDLADDELTPLRPFVIVQEQSFGFNVEGTGPFGKVTGVGSAAYGVLITQNSIHPGEMSNQLHRLAKQHFLDFAGCLVVDIREAAGRDNNFIFRDYLTQGPAERLPSTGRSRDNDYWELAVVYNSGLDDT